MRSPDRSRNAVEPDGPFLRSLAVRIALMAGLWVVLAGLDSKTWPLAAALVVIAAYASLRSLPPDSVRLSARGTAAFLPFFLLYSIRGGADVAARAMRLSPRLDPGTVDFTTTLPVGAPRTFFVAVIGLQPGTLTATVDGDRLRVHVLDRGVDIDPQLRALEVRVAALFGLPDPTRL